MWTRGECAIGVHRLPQATAPHLVDMQNMYVVVPGEVLSARVSLGRPNLTKRKILFGFDSILHALCCTVEIKRGAGLVFMTT